jgi:hypothetical protein
MSFDPFNLAEQLRNHGADWADKNAAAKLLEETQDTLHAELSLRFRSEAGSVAEAKLMASACEEYKTHVKAAVEARGVANMAKVQYDSDKALIDMIRTKESSERAAMSLR